jgi:hypothetical protein
MGMLSINLRDTIESSAAARSECRGRAFKSILQLSTVFALIEHEDAELVHRVDTSVNTARGSARATLDIVAVQVHNLAPGGGEVFDEGVFRVIAGVDFR